jgi:glycosyltransferase involved in cell wall biosynthesis
MKPTAIVLTYNEEKHIRDCLVSLRWCDQVWVVDSCSTDGTLAIVREFPAQIAERKFTNYFRSARMGAPLARHPRGMGAVRRQ